jgi:hypothetical protein
MSSGPSGSLKDHMPEYLCLLYADNSDPAAQEERWKDLPAWAELAEELRRAGALIANNALQNADRAKTVRAPRGEVAITDGPFATTKETLVGYFLLRCADIDEALAHAQRLPVARYGSVEVRPVKAVEVV